MKKALVLFIIVSLFFTINSFSESNEKITLSTTKEGDVQTTQTNKKDNDTPSAPSNNSNVGLPTFEELLESQQHFGIMYNWGLSWGWITRIKKQENRSNFVWNDKLVGAFFEVQSHNLLSLGNFLSFNFTGRVAIHYPYSYTFNKVPQFAKQTILYNIDLFIAPVLTMNIFKIARLDLELGLHVSYQLSDKWHYWNIGPGVKFDLEFPISSSWTAIIGGLFSWDNGNLGTNGRMQPLNYVYEYQGQIGARYSYNFRNPFSYIPYKSPKSKRAQEKLIIKVHPEEKARIKAERKAAREEKKNKESAS